MQLSTNFNVWNACILEMILIKFQYHVLLKDLENIGRENAIIGGYSQSVP